MPKKLTQEEVAEYLKEKGYELLSEYNGVKGRIKVKSLKGDTFYSSLYNFKRGHLPERTNQPLEKEFVKKELNDSGYFLEGEYESAHVKMNIVCENRHKWSVSYSTFHRGFRCPECNNTKVGGRSFGERAINILLEYNSDIFKKIKKEVSIVIGDSTHRFDFTFELNGEKYIIEYDGIQHFKESTGVFFNRLDNQKQRDNIKNVYAKENNINMIRIPYTVDTFENIADELSRLLNVKIHIPEKIFFSGMSDITDYYLSHTLQETVDKYKTSRYNVAIYFKKIHGMSKNEYIKTDVVEYYKNHTGKETSDKYNISSGVIAEWFNQIYGVNKTIYLKQQKLKGLA